MELQEVCMLSWKACMCAGNQAPVKRGVEDLRSSVQDNFLLIWLKKRAGSSFQVLYTLLFYSIL